MNSSALRGILWMLLTTLLFVLVTAIVRFIGDGIPASQAAFIRYVIGTIILLPFILPLIKKSINKKDLIIYIFRGFAHGAGVILWFYAMSRIPIAEVTAISYTGPIYISIGAAIFFGEKLALRRIIAIFIAFIGTLIILRPGFQEISTGQLAQIISAPLFAISYLLSLYSCLFLDINKFILFPTYYCGAHTCLGTCPIWLARGDVIFGPGMG